MKYFSLLLITFSAIIIAECTEEDCGPPLGMPNYLCSDGVTVAGPGDCIVTALGDCVWDIISCPESDFTGFLRHIEVSACQDYCSAYNLETEDGEYLTNVTNLEDIESLNYFDGRYIEIAGEEVWCVECGAVDVHEIAISHACEMPVDCFQDPCLEANCPAYPNAECVANYCGGCHADFYFNGELITDCISNNECTDLSGIFFGICDMWLGIGFSDGACNLLSGCGWEVDGVDYSEAFFDTFAECEAACFEYQPTCDEITAEYESLHFGEYAVCEYDIDCMAVWGDCAVGLGGCHYSVNAENYPEEEINLLVEQWLENDCMEWVCDCSAEPYAQCLYSACTSAYCFGENPAGCSQTGCPEGFDCVVNTNDCIPSYCECDGFYGNWFCTEDCGGGTCMASGMMGDLNIDGLIDVLDIILAVDFILHSEYNPLADLNTDGTVNVLDIILLVNLILS